VGEAGVNEFFLALPEALLRNYSIGQLTPQPALLVPRTPLCNTVKHVVHCVGNTTTTTTTIATTVNQLQLFKRGSDDQSLTARCSVPEQQEHTKPRQKQIPKHASKRKRSSSSSSSSNSNSSDTVKTKAASLAAAAAAAETNTSANCRAAASSNESSKNVKDPNVKSPTLQLVQGNKTNNRTCGGSDNAVLKRPRKGSAAVRKTTAKIKTITRPRQQRTLSSKSTSKDTTTMDETSSTSHKKKASTRKRRRTKSDKDDEDGNNDKDNDNGKQPKTLPVFAPTTARSRADLELFARTKVDILQAEYLSNVQALRQKLEVLQARSTSMTARHEIHAKRDVDAQIVRVENELTMLESGNVLRKFKREAACVLFAYDNLVLEQNADADGVAKKGVEVVVQEDQANALPPATLRSSTSRNLESARTVSDEASHSSLNEEIADDNKEKKAASSDGGVEVSSIVADEDSGSVIERRRHVSKPDMRVLTRGQNHAAAVADSFLERNGGLVTKPMCCISDTQCIRCQGQLVLDVSSDLFVCVDCHFEQSTTHSSEHSIGYGNTSSVTFNSCRYTRETHFINYLDRFGGCVGSEKITDELVFSVMKWMKDRGVAADAVSAQIVTMALHDLGYRELKQHKVIIMARITGVKPKSFSPEQRTQLIDMFRQVSRAFDELRRKGRFPHRVNFLSYRYTIFKFLEMLTWGEEFKASFEVLKGPGNLENQDEYWKCICDYLDFHFIPTAPLVQVHIDLLLPHCAVCSQPKTLVCANCHN
jgi:hypothetical protein